MNGLHGRHLTKLPWKFRLLWVVAPHAAVLHGGLEAYGVQFSLHNIFRHLMNAAASSLGLFLESILVNLLSMALWDLTQERRFLSGLLQVCLKLAGLKSAVLRFSVC